MVRYFLFHSDVRNQVVSNQVVRNQVATEGALTGTEEREAPVCRHFQRAAEIIGKRWTTQILRGLLSGDTRYSQLSHGIAGISDKVLSERLKELEAEGIVERCVTPDTPVRIDYRLTEKGRDLSQAIEALAGWAERWATASRDA
jgi:DNA-binding HxlR family transcriptional regulator